MDELSSPPPSSSGDGSPPTPATASRKRQLESPSRAAESGSMFGYFARMFKTPRKSKDHDVSSSSNTAAAATTAGVSDAVHESHPTTPAPSMVLNKIDLKTPTEEEMRSSQLPFPLEDVAVNGHAKSPLVSTPATSTTTETDGTAASSTTNQPSIAPVALNGGGVRRTKSAFLKSSQKKKITFASNTMAATTTSKQYANSPHPNRNTSTSISSPLESSTSSKPTNGVASASSRNSISFASSTVTANTLTASKYENSPYPNRGARQRRAGLPTSFIRNSESESNSTNAVAPAPSSELQLAQQTPKLSASFSSLNPNVPFSAGLRTRTRRFRPAAQIFTAPVLSKSQFHNTGRRTDAERKKVQEQNFKMAQQIVNSLASISNSDDALFERPANVQRMKFGRVLGSNQTGESRRHLEIGGKSNADIIKERRNDMKSSAFGDIMLKTSTNSTLLAKSDNREANSSSSETTLTRKGDSKITTETNKDATIDFDDEDKLDGQHADASRIKRRKVTFNTSQSKQENVTTDKAGNSSSDAVKPSMPTRSTPYVKKSAPIKWVGQLQDGRDPSDGSITFPEEVIYGRKLNLHTRLGRSSEAEPENSLIADVMENITYRRINFPSLPKRTIAQEPPNDTTAMTPSTTVGSNNSTLPFNFIKENPPTSTKKGSSSIMNKDLSKISATKSDIAPREDSKPVVTSGWGDMLKQYAKQEGEWQCKCCYVNNKADAQSCVSCDTKRGEVGKSKEEVEKDSEKENEEKNAAIRKIFGAPNEGTSSSAGASNFANSSFGSGGFVFGGVNTATSEGKEKSDGKATGFVFGSGETTSGEKKEASKGFVFGSNLQNEKKEEGGKPFVFGSATTPSVDKGEISKDHKVVQASTVPKANFKGANGFTFGSSSAVTTSSSLSDEVKPSENSIQSAKKKRSLGGDEETRSTSYESKTSSSSSFTFGSSSNGNGSTGLNTSGLDNSNTSSLDANAKPFIFGTGSSGKTDSTPVPALGTSTTPTPAMSSDKDTTAPSIPPSTPAFTFGSSDSSKTVPTSSQDLSKSSASGPTFTFGAPTSSTQAAPTEEASKAPAPATAPTFSFGGTTTSKPAVDTKDAPSSSETFKFGNSNPPVPASAAVLNAKSNGSSTAPPFAFGSSKPVTASAPSFAFGSSSTPAAPAAPTFPIKSESSSKPSSDSNFTFGGATQTESTTAPNTDSNQTKTSFSFSSGSTQAPTNAGGFTFGGAAAQPPSTSTTFGSSAATSSAPAPSIGFSFGQASQAPSSGFGSTGGFGATPAPATGFGATGNTTGGATTSGFGSTMTSFGSANAVTPAPTTTPGFSFGSQSQPAATPAPMFGSGATSNTFGATVAPTNPAPAVPTANGGFSATVPAGGFSIGKGPSTRGGKTGRRILKARRPGR